MELLSTLSVHFLETLYAHTVCPYTEEARCCSRWGESVSGSVQSDYDITFALTEAGISNQNHYPNIQLHSAIQSVFKYFWL